MALRQGGGLFHVASSPAACRNEPRRFPGKVPRARVRRGSCREPNAWRRILLSACAPAAQDGGRQAAAAAPPRPPPPPGEAQRPVQFRPCIDIHKGKVKQIVGSSLRDTPFGGAHVADSMGPTSSSSSSSSSSAPPSNPPGDAPPGGGGGGGGNGLITNFVSDQSSAEFARLYSRDGLAGGHVIMLGADDATRAAALDALRAYPGGMQVGGGITCDNAASYLDAGASHVIVTSYVFREGRLDEERLRALVARVGRQRLVLDLSCREQDGVFKVVTDRWQRFSDLVVDERSLAQLAASADEFLVHGVDVEGMRLGIDDKLVELLGRCSPIPVTYAGGARALEDLERVKAAGRGRVDITVGSALDIFGGSLPYEAVVQWHKSQLQAYSGKP